MREASTLRSLAASLSLVYGVDCRASTKTQRFSALKTHEAIMLRCAGQLLLGLCCTCGRAERVCIDRWELRMQQSVVKPKGAQGAPPDARRSNGGDICSDDLNRSPLQRGDSQPPAAGWRPGRQRRWTAPERAPLSPASPWSAPTPADQGSAKHHNACGRSPPILNSLIGFLLSTATCSARFSGSCTAETQRFGVSSDSSRHL